MNLQFSLFTAGLSRALLMGALLFSGVIARGQTYTFSTIAGTPRVAGSADGTGSAARFNYPVRLAVDNAGNLYVADYFNHTIRKVTSAGVVTTLAGLAGSSGAVDGTGSAARFFYPGDIAIDPDGNLYVPEFPNHTIRKVTPAGVVTTFAGLAGSSGAVDGVGSAARFTQPFGVAADSSGNIYVADTGASTIRKITSAGAVTTIAGLAGATGSVDGTGSAARFYLPADVAVDGAGILTVLDRSNHTIRRIAPGGVVTTLAGVPGLSGWADGTGSGARFNQPNGLTAESTGTLFVADTYNHVIRKVSLNGTVITVGGYPGSAGYQDAVGPNARFNTPHGIAVDSEGTIYIADYENHVIRKGIPNPLRPHITSETSASGAFGQDFIYRITASNSPTDFDALNLPPGLSVDHTTGIISGLPSQIGSFTVSIAASNVTGTAVADLFITITKATATVSLSQLTQTFDGSPKSVNVTTTPAGLATDVLYAGSATPPTNVGSYVVNATVNSPNYTGSLSAFLTIERASATVTLGNLSATYDGSAKPVTATTSPAGLAVRVTYNGLDTAPSGAGSYDVVATVTNSNYTAGSAIGTLVIEKATTTVTLSNSNQTFDGSPKTLNVTTSPAGLTTDVLYSGSSTPPSAAGTYDVVATVNSSNYTGSTNGTLVITKATATVTLSNLTQKFDGTAKSPSVTTSPAGLATDVLYAGSTTPPTGAGSYAVTATINHPNYTGSTSGTFTIERAAATVTLGNLSATYDGSAKPVTTTTAPAGLVVSVIYNGLETAPTAAGSYDVVASVSDSNYTGSAIGTLVIAKAAATVTLANLTQTFDGSPRSANVTTNPAGLVTNILYAGSATAPTSAGSYAVTATVNSPNYTGSAGGTLTISPASATVALGNFNATYDGLAKPVTVATSPAGLAVSVTYNGLVSVPSEAGSYDVVASVNNSNYTGAASGTLVIAKASATVTLSNLTQTGDGTPKSVSVTTAPAGLATIVTYNGSTTVPSAAGSYAVVATVTNANYQGSTTGTLTITDSTPLAITSQPGSPTVVAGQTVTLAVTATASQPISYQWYNRSTAIAGATNPSLVLTNVAAADDSDYRVVVSTSTTSLVSAWARVTVLLPPAITEQPAAASVDSGRNATFTVRATGSGSLSYQWRKGGVILTGETSNRLQLKKVVSADAGAYDVIVTNAAGSVTSVAAQLTVR